MLLGVHFATEDAARREYDHPCELRTQLRERLVVELLGVFAAALADPIRFGLRLRADLGCCRLGGLCHPLRDRLRVSARLTEKTLDFRRHALAFGLGLLGHREAFADLLRTRGEHVEDRSPEVPTQ